MKLVEATLTPADCAALRAEVAALSATLPSCASYSAGAFMADLYRAHLRERRAAKIAEADRLTRQYEDAWMAFAARTFKKLRGAIEIADLQGWAYEEARKAMMRFDPSLGYSPASSIKGWLGFALRGYLRDHFQGELPEGMSLIFADGDHGDDDRSKWEKIGGEDASLEAAPENAETRTRMIDFLRTLSGAERKIAKLLVKGLDEDQISEKLPGVPLEGIEAVRAAFAAALGRELEADLSPAEIETKHAVPVKLTHKALNAGALPGRKRGGEWRVRESDLRAWLRRREVAAQDKATRAQEKAARHTPR